MCKIAAGIIKKNPFHVIFIVQLLVFHLSNLVLFTTIKKYSTSASIFFIALSSFNVINLSFTNLLLTENLSYLFLALIFYFFLKEKKKAIDLIALALVSSLAIYIRPAFLLMYIAIFLIIGYKLLIKNKNVKYFILFFVFSLTVLSIGGINTYINSKTIGILNPRSTGEYVEQIYHGSFLMKYETNIDINEKSQIMQYVYKGRYYLLNNKCKDVLLTCIGIYESPICPKALIDCQIQSLQSKPYDYVTLTSLHLFNFFDRTYIDTYINKITDRNIFMQLGNYLVISSFILYFFVKKNKKFRSLLFIITFFIAINTILYLPTKVEPRFSSPIFPLLLIVFCFYILDIVKNKQYRYLWINGIFVGLFFIMSELVNLTLKVSDIPVHLVK